MAQVSHPTFVLDLKLGAPDDLLWAYTESVLYGEAKARAI
jgi:hypothetical protein